MDLLIMTGVFICAGIVQSITGFGSSVTMMLVMPWFMDMHSASALSGAATLGLTGVLAWKYRKKLRLKSIMLPLTVYSVASVLAVNFAGGMDMEFLSMLLGVFFILLSLFFLFFSERLRLRDSVPTAFICAAVSGIISGIFSLGGPLMTLYFVSVTDDREDYLARSQVMYFITGSIILVSRVFKGLYTVSLIPLTLLGMAGVNAGKIIGLRLAGHIDGKAFRKLVYISVGIAGLVTVLEHI